jgi:hypothetical protein
VRTAPSDPLLLVGATSKGAGSVVARGQPAQNNDSGRIQVRVRSGLDARGSSSLTFWSPRLNFAGPWRLRPWEGTLAGAIGRAGPLESGF